MICIPVETFENVNVVSAANVLVNVCAVAQSTAVPLKAAAVVNSAPSLEYPTASAAILALVIPKSFTLIASEFISIVESSTLTAKVLLDYISPPPVSPSPAVSVTEVWFICSFDTKPLRESWTGGVYVKTPELLL